MRPAAEPIARADLHSHLVPGVDDGAKSVDDVIEGVGRMRDLGITTIVTTPHYAASVTLDREEHAFQMGEMDEAFERARAAVLERWPETTFLRGNEVALDHPEPDLSDRRLRLGDGPYLLVEWARFQVPPGSGRVLARLREQGVEPVLAHPERYRGPRPHVDRMGEWREAGARLQVNYGSLAGVYGPEPRETAFELLARGWVDCLATDFHGRPALPLFIESAAEYFVDGEGDPQARERAWELLTGTNPERIIRGEAPLPVPALPRDHTLWSRMVSLFR